MVTREQFYEQFGPKGIEAVCVLMTSQINVVRQHIGLEQVTQEQVLDALQNIFVSLPDYDFMNEPQENI